MQAVQPNIPLPAPMAAQPASFGSASAEAALGRLPTQTIAPSIAKPETYPDRQPQGAVYGRTLNVPLPLPASASGFTAALPLSPSPSPPGFSSLFMAQMIGQEVAGMDPLLRDVEGAYVAKSAPSSEARPEMGSLRPVFTQILHEQASVPHTPASTAAPPPTPTAPAAAAQAEPEAPLSQLAQAAVALNLQPAPKPLRRDAGTFITGHQAYGATNARNQRLDKTEPPEEEISLDEAA